LCFPAAIGTGLLGLSLDQLLRVDPGYDPHHLFTMTAFAHDHKNGEEVLGYYRQLMERVRALPGVESVGMASAPPLSGGPQRLYIAKANLRRPLALSWPIWPLPRQTTST